jgi:hypothetical protein
LRRKVAVGTIGVVAAGGAFLAIGPSSASGSTHASTVTTKYFTSTHSFQGRVHSDTHDCERGRSVTVYKKVGNNSVAVGTKVTNIAGFYRIPAPLVAGTYWAVAKRMTLPGYSSTVCARAVSSLRVIS